MRYLITGATGFIGPHLIKRLSDAGHQCRCLIRANSDTAPLDSLNVELVDGDITQAKTLVGIADDVDVVLHLATLGHMSNFAVAEDMFESVNVHGAVNVMREAKRARVKRIVHCSTVAAMGICTEVPADEKSPCNPHHPYGKSKLMAEKAVLDLVAKDGLPAVIVRFSMVYGPGDPRDILKLTRLAQKGLFPKVGSRAKLTPLIHVDDAVQGLLLAAEKGLIGHIYLITNQKSLPFDDIRKILQKALGVRRIPLYVPEWLALSIASIIEHVFPVFGKVPPVSRKNIESTLADRVFSIEKAQKEIGFKPQMDTTDGLVQTVAWYQEHGWL